MPKKNMALWILSLIPLVMVLGNSMLIPILPKMGKIFAVSQFQTSLMITSFSIAACIFIPLAGFISDRAVRKKVIAGGLILYGLGGIGAGAAAVFLQSRAYYAILAFRVLQGIGASATAPIAMALSSDLFSGSERSHALGIIEASNGMGKVLSPILGSLLALISWMAVFWAFPAICLPLAAAVWWGIDEEENTSAKKKPSVSQYAQDLKKIFHARGLFLAVTFFSAAVTLFVIFGILFYMSNLLEEKYHITSLWKGFILAFPLLFMVTTSYLTGKFIKKKIDLMKNLVLIGLILMAFSTGIAIFFAKTYILLICLALTGIGAGLILPSLNTLITSSISAAERGIITALYGSVRFLGVALGPPLFGLLCKLGGRWVYGVSSALVVLAAVVVFFGMHKSASSVSRS